MKDSELYKVSNKAYFILEESLDGNPEMFFRVQWTKSSGSMSTTRHVHWNLAQFLHISP